MDPCDCAKSKCFIHLMLNLVLESSYIFTCQIVLPRLKMCIVLRVAMGGL